jgi:hypothetical protein
MRMKMKMMAKRTDSRTVVVAGVVTKESVAVATKMTAEVAAAIATTSKRMMQMAVAAAIAAGVIRTGRVIATLKPTPMVVVSKIELIFQHQSDL